MISRVWMAGWIAAACCVLAVPSADAQTRRERELTRLMTSGRAALEDGLYQLAQKNFESYVKKARGLEAKAEGTLWVARAMHHQGAHRDILSLLAKRADWANTPALQEGFRFWRARAHYDLQAIDRALHELEGMDLDLAQSEYGQQIHRLLARCLMAAGRYTESVALLERYDRAYPAAADALANRLDWAGSLIELDRDKDAERILEELIGSHPASEASLTARLWLSYLFIEQEAWARAQVLLEELIRLDDKPSNRAADTQYALARVHEAGDRLDDAITALKQGESRARDPALKNRGKLLRARVMMRAGDTDAGVQLLRECIVAMPGHPVSAQAQLDLAQALLDQEQYAEALKEFQHYLDAFDDDQGRANALLGRGWSLLGLKRYSEAASSFEKAYTLHPDLVERKQALFKVADSYFQNGQYRRARDEYIQLTKVFPGSDLVPRAMFQAAECLARQRMAAEAVQEFLAIENAYVESAYAEQAGLRIGLLQEEMGQWERAITAYNRVMTGYPDSTAFAQALHQRGLIRYRLGFFQEALNDFERMVGEFPKHEATEQAFYMRGWSLYLLGQSTPALQVSQDFIRRYPRSRWAPDVLFWLAEFHYNQAEYGAAESRFKDLADTYPKGALADDALYWAGRAAVEQQEYLRAVDHFNRLARNYPDSSRMPELRFAQGDTLSHLGKFAGAILAFEEIIKKYPSSYLVDMAWGRRGDCQFTLGNEEPGRFAEAIASYQAVIDSPTAPSNLKLQAEYKIGRCYEKMGRMPDALERYMSVVYHFLEDRQLRTPDGIVWFTRSAFGAAGVKEAEGDMDAAVQILQRVISAGVPSASEAERRMEKIRLDNPLSFFKDNDISI